MIRFGLLLVLLSARLTDAVTLILDNADIVMPAGNEANAAPQSMSLTPRFSGTGAIESDVQVQQAHTHNGNNGGWAQSGVPHWAYKFNARSGATPSRAYVAWAPACDCNAALDCAASGGLCAGSGTAAAGVCVVGDATKLDCRNAAGDPEDTNCAAVRGCAPRQKLSEDFLSVSFSAWLDSAPSSGKARTIASFTLSDGSLGCFARVNPSGTISVYYKDASLSNPGGGLVGTSAAKLTRHACVDPDITPAADGTTPNVEEGLISCTSPGSGAECPTSSSCGSCDTGGSSTDGTSCFWGGIEFSQQNIQTTGTFSTYCDLWMNGSQQVIGSTNPVIANVPRDISDFHIGFDCAMGTAGCASGSSEDTPAVLYVTDIVADLDARQGWGFVGSEVPAGQGGVNTFGGNGGGACASNTLAPCVNDFGTSPFTHDKTLFELVPGPQPAGQLLLPWVAPTLSVPFAKNGLNATVTAAEAVLVGFNGSSAGQRDFTLNLYTCDNTTNATGCHKGAAHPFRLGCNACGGTMKADQVAHVLDRYTISGPFTGTGRWDATAIAQLTVEAHAPINTCNSTNAPTNTPCIAGSRNFGISAQQVHLRVQRPDTPAFVTIRDHNVGVKSCTVDADCFAGAPSGSCVGSLCVKDGFKTGWSWGDSTNGNTLGATCRSNDPAINGKVCSVSSHCDPDPTQDHPQGGCGIPPALDDSQCITCAGHRDDYNGGAGFPCPNGVSQCGDTSLWTCNNATRTCNQNLFVPCPNGTNAECVAFGNLGACETGRHCVESCPGGSCPPAQTPWSLGIPPKVGADEIIRCGVGGMNSPGLFSGTQTAAAWQLGHDPGRSCVADVGFGQCSCDPHDATTECGSGGVCSLTTDKRGFCATNATTLCDQDSDCGVTVHCLGVCTAGIPVSRTACQNAPIDCYAGTARSCVWHPPDNEWISIGYNDNSLFAPHDPHCNDFMYNKAACGTCTATPCTNDNECGAISPVDSYCLGTSSSFGFGTVFSACDEGTNFFGGPICTMASKACATNTDCPGGLVCIGGHASDIYPHGFCKCTLDAQCRALVGSAFVCAKNGQANGWCRKTCIADADCWGSGASQQTCATITATDTGVTKTCRGECSCPSSRTCCTTDADCKGVNPSSWTSSGLNQDGTCTGPTTGCTGGQKRCQYTGINRCFAWKQCQGGTKAGEDCRLDSDCPGGGTCDRDAGASASFISWSKLHGHFYTQTNILNFKRLQEFAFGLPAFPIPHPLLMVGTLPLTAQKRDGICPDLHRPWTQDDVLYKTREWLNTFPNAVDAMEAVAESAVASHGYDTDTSACFLDEVHPTNLCVPIWGGEWGDVIQSTNVCVRTCAADSDCRHKNSNGFTCYGGSTPGFGCVPGRGKCAAGSKAGQVCLTGADCPGSACAATCPGGTCIGACNTVTGKCAKWLRKPRKYCMLGDGNYRLPARSCSQNLDCLASETCQLRLCTNATEGATDTGSAAGNNCPTDGSNGAASYCNEEVL